VIVQVMVSFKMDKQLQTISNYYLFSLAVADFIIGVFSMPIYTVNMIAGMLPLFSLFLYHLKGAQA
jgi:muscarinic acetylcholine receptor M3